MAIRWLRKLCSKSHPSRPPFSSFPPTVEELLRNSHLFNLYETPLPKPDTQLDILYRMYCGVVAADITLMRNEIERFWNRHHWAVSDIPDPHDPDPTRYTVLATLPYLLVRAFNERIALGLPRDAPAIFGDEEMAEFQARPKKFESVPQWAEHVPPLKETLFIPDEEGLLPVAGGWVREDPQMLMKNIVTNMLHTSFA